MPCSKVLPLRNCVIRNSGLISLNRISLYKKLSRLIHVMFLLQWYIVIFHGIYLNVSPIDDYAKDGGEELFTKMHCVLITNP